MGLEGSVVVVMGNVEVEVDGEEHIICGMSLVDNGIVGGIQGGGSIKRWRNKEIFGEGMKTTRIDA